MAFIIIIAACVKTRKTADPAEYAEYISGYTTGVISKNEPVRIKLAVGNLKFEIGKELPADILTFEPAVKGKRYFICRRYADFSSLPLHGLPGKPFQQTWTWVK